MGATIIGTGCDLTPVARLEAACRRHPSLLGRLFTPRELERAGQAGPLRWERLAGCFAAKESVQKALGVGMRLGFMELEVGHEPGGRPVLHLGPGAEELARSLGVVRIHLSISHAGGMALATALAEGAPGGQTS